MSSGTEWIEVAAEVQLGNYKPAKIVFASGAGCDIEDCDGNRYVDLCGGIAVLSLGHCHPALTSAIADQAKRLMHVSNLFYNERSIQLAKRLAERTPFNRVFFCNSGSEANEAMIKLARRFHFGRGDSTRTEIVAAWNGFHGRTLGALSCTGRTKYHEGMTPLLPGVKFIDFNDVAALRAAVNEKTAAVILEPIQGEGGVYVATNAFMHAAREVCTERGALLLFDEVQTGFGRTGAFLAQEHYGISADAVSLAKGMGGGFPVGAMLVKEQFADGLPPGSHGTTFGGNPLACAAALAVLNTIEQDGLIARAAELGTFLERELRAIAAKHPSVVIEVRGRGLLYAIDLRETVAAADVLAKLHEAGVLLSAAGTAIRFSPPLVVTEAQLQRGVSALDTVLTQIESNAWDSQDTSLRSEISAAKAF